MSDLKVALGELHDETGSQPRLVPARQPARRLVPIALAAAGAAVLIAGIWFFVRDRRSPSTSSAPMRLTLESGSAAYPTISRDGKLIAYASDRSGNFDIYVQQVGGKHTIRVTSSPFDEIEPAFTPDATQIVFYSKQDGGGLYVVSTLGGEPRLLVSGGYGARVSPDGKLVAYWIARQPPAVSGGDRIAVIPISGGSARVIHPELQAADPIWSPDGKYLLFSAYAAPQFDLDWWVAPVEGGPAVPTGALGVFSATSQFKRGGPPAFWHANRVYGSVTFGDSSNLWSVALSPQTEKAYGSSVRLTDSTQSEGHFSISEAGLMVSASHLRNEDIYSLPLDAEQGKVTGPLRRLTQDLSQETFPTASADGSKLAYQSNRSGKKEVWVRDVATGRESALAALTPGVTTSSIISPDGSQAAYTVIGENAKLYVVSTSGGTPRAVCDWALLLAWSPDGRSLIVGSLEKMKTDRTKVGEAYVARVELSTGKRTPLAVPVGNATASPDERWVALSVQQDGYHSQIFVMPLANTAAPKEQWILIEKDVPGLQAFGWSPQGRFLYWFSNQDGRDCLYGRPLDAATKRPAGLL